MSILTAYLKKQKYDYEITEAYKEFFQEVEALTQAMAQGLPQEFISKHTREMAKAYRRLQDVEQCAVNDGLTVALKVEVKQ